MAKKPGLEEEVEWYLKGKVGKDYLTQFLDHHTDLVSRNERTADCQSYDI